MNKLENFRPYMPIESFQTILRDQASEDSRIKSVTFLALAHASIEHLCLGIPPERVAKVIEYGAERQKIITEFLKSLQQLNDLYEELGWDDISYQDYKEAKRIVAKIYWSLHEEMAVDDLRQWETNVPEVGALALKLVRKNNEWEFNEPSPLASFDYYLRDIMQGLDFKRQPVISHKQLNALLCFCLSRVDLTETELLQRFESLLLSDKHGEKRNALREQYSLAKKNAEAIKAKREADKEARIASRKSILQAQLKMLTKLSQDIKGSQDYKDYSQVKERTVVLMRALALFCTEEELVSHPILAKESQELFYRLKNKISQAS